MNNKKSTKRALVTSILSLVLCMSMLIGTTFAWFTDSVTSAGNKIQAGNLDVDLYMWNGTDEANRVEITNESAPIFGADTSSLAQNDNADTLWEPGKTQVVYLSIKNNGSLDLKYKAAIDVRNPENVDSKNLYEVMQYAITPDAKYGDVTAWNGGKNVVLGTNATDANDVTLKKGEEHFFALSVHMEEDAGNEYMGGSVEFDISVLAGQLASESDSFNNQYDALASYAGTAFGKLKAGDTAVELQILGKDNYKVGSAVVPEDAIADVNKPVEVNIDDTVYEGNISVQAGYEKKSYEVTVSNLKENNDEPIKVQLKIEKDIDPATVTLFHRDEKIENATYNPNTGYVTFYSTSFSPFTIVYDADSEYEEPTPEESDLPGATVDRSQEYENTILPWGSYGQWSPTEGLEANLEAAYTFSCKETIDQAKVNEYANWYCDFYVVLDKPLGENQIFLGGNYGSFGWVGFHNGDLTLEANTEIPLLGSVTTNPWTYLDVVQNVGTFICGVGDVDNALSGAKFTVMLRLTNPADETDFVNVATIEHIFE